MKKFDHIKNRLTAFPKVKLGAYPTPLHYLPRLSSQLGVEIYLKREDLSGFSPFGGNKIRKLEYLLGDALKNNCDTVITFGATQSNHAMQTVTACRKYGLSPHLFLRRVIKEDTELRANLLIDNLMGADVHYSASREESQKQAEQSAARLEQEGHRCYIIPGGGSNEIGAAGFIDAFIELTEQLSADNSEPDYLFHATGSGGTLAGLLAGKSLSASSVKIISIAVGEKDTNAYAETILDLARRTIASTGIPADLSAGDIHIDHNFYRPGYEMPNDSATEAIHLLARTEGILLDPVYTGKAFAGMLHYIRSRIIPQGSRVVFLHTGGTLALFAEKAITGDL
ncbi:1-aminocyclopropane-1-carboxylate deaminase/D-cysteine desulfhydrase [Pectinatus haikarae]|uniref:D-cysteine desulfhydrase family pyridoxal phosphate-dependent enzyme n=1 Tax=Pectinatus haikarae TaxID=349096 RepID=A0ABT9Y9U8_9FIRM|nr:D-cysteine desulfhydrase family protein [Pectinatus haikarae]MDQ0204504.1 D-cysteine desulfhydrase family pyridoxal phosphate-dependent enzyme [Pectinatus haikarae]